MVNKATGASPDFNREYEELRDNVLGRTNHCRGLAVFLRQGMVSWMMILQTPADHEPGKISKSGNSSPFSANNNRVTAGLAEVLVDMLISSNGNV